MSLHKAEPGNCGPLTYQSTKMHCSWTKNSRFSGQQDSTLWLLPHYTTKPRSKDNNVIITGLTNAVKVLAKDVSIGLGELGARINVLEGTGSKKAISERVQHETLEVQSRNQSATTDDRLSPLHLSGLIGQLRRPQTLLRTMHQSGQRRMMRLQDRNLSQFRSELQRPWRRPSPCQSTTIPGRQGVVIAMCPVLPSATAIKNFDHQNSVLIAWSSLCAPLDRLIYLQMMPWLLDDAINVRILYDPTHMPTVTPTN